MNATSLFPALREALREIEAGTVAIGPERRAVLDSIADHVRARHDAGDTARLLFVCTHNSRRSHFAQIWARVAATWHGVDDVEVFSGGTEATAVAPPVVASLHRHGLRIEKEPGRDNPVHLVRFAAEAPAERCFSKVFDAAANPREGFAAVMVCASADADCPVVPGADARFSLSFDDPKESDGRPDEATTYDARGREIAAAMLHLFRRVAATD